MMNLALAKTDTARATSDIFAAARDRLPGKDAVAEVRLRAFGAYERAGLPHRRIEEWKYTDLRALMREVLPLAPAPDTAAFKRAEAALASLASVDSQRLVLVDGVFAPALSDLSALERGVRVQTLREALEDQNDDENAELLDSGAIS